MKHIGLVDVTVESVIQDVNENILYKEYETRAVEREIDYIKKIKLPSEIPPGNYLFLVNLRYEDDLAISGYPFYILDKPMQERNYLIFVYSIISILTLMVFILVSYYYYRKLERKIRIKLSEKGPGKLIKERGG